MLDEIVGFAVDVGAAVVNAAVVTSAVVTIGAAVVGICAAVVNADVVRAHGRAVGVGPTPTVQTAPSPMNPALHEHTPSKHLAFTSHSLKLALLLPQATLGTGKNLTLPIPNTRPYKSAKTITEMTVA